MMMRLVIFQTLLFISINSYAQQFLNGDFENTTATSDLINLSNTEVISRLPHVTSFGSYGDVDIINSATYGGLAQNKQWYIALTGGGTDIVALELSIELIAGKKYGISFYDRCGKGYTASPFQIGLSANSTSFGTVIYTSPQVSTPETWTERRFTFIAPHNGKYITVQMTEGTISNWAHIDNFTFTKNYCLEKINLNASKLAINKGDEITLTASGATNYNWLNTDTENQVNNNVVKIKPLVSRIYTITSKEDNCPLLTATIAITVKNLIKKDTVVIQKQPPIDTTIKPKITHQSFSRKKLNGRKIIIQEQLITVENSVKIAIYDKNRLDGDVVSIYINGKLFKSNIIVTKTKQEFMIELQEGSNFIVMEAINLGTVPPNTAGISITEQGKKAKLTTLISDLKKSGALEIIYQPDGLTTL